MRGNPPKRDEDRIRRNKPVLSRLPIEWDGKTRGPDLPEIDDPGWHPMVLEWYEVFRRSPQSMVCADTDWLFIRDTAFIYQLFWDAPEKFHNAKLGYIKEFRQRMGMYGATFEDRLKLRMDVNTPQSSQSEQKQIENDAAKAVDYLEMVTKKAAEIQEK